jgi:hypothetical protein
MSTKQKIFLGIAIIVAGAAWYGYAQYTRKNKDLAYTKSDVRITSGELIRSFEADEKLSNEKFLDRIISVEGRLKEINKDEKGYFTLVLGTTNSMSSVRCSMDSAHQQDIASIKPGGQIIIKGVCTGFNKDELLGSDVILNRGVIAKKIDY